MSENRSVRIFISSTFRDFAAERDLLVRRVFPALRANLQERFVELVDVDLRWGITAEQAERGEVLPICLAEIDRSRPYFVGLLGDRYGWTPAAAAYASGLLERESWLRQHQGDKSVTELEILHGVLNNREMAGRALFYFRSSAYAESRGGDYLSGSEAERSQQMALKASIRLSGFPVVEDYADPEALAERLHQDLWAILDATFPAEDVPDAITRVSRQHEAYAAPRRRLYLGGERYLGALNDAVAQQSRILVEGPSGGGKSALLANWLSLWRQTHPEDIVHEHYLAAASDAAESASLVRRLVEAIKRATGSEDSIASDSLKLFESLPTWLAAASAHARQQGRRWIIALDGLNGLKDLQDLRWLPEFLPERVHLVVSCLPGPVLEALKGKGEWHRIHVEPLSIEEREALLIRFLAQYNKTLAPDQLRQVVSHPLASNPLFLRTLAEELRVFGVYELLAERLQFYLDSHTVVDLFDRVLARIEEDFGREQVREAAIAIRVSRAGLGEKEIQGFADLVPATWAPIRYALSEALLETNGRLTFAHDYLRQAVTARYLPEAGDQVGAHRALAEWFATQAVDARVAEELPWQWQQAGAWEDLGACLTARPVFEAICAIRRDNDEELLRYWLDLEHHAGRSIEDSYSSAWIRWTDAEREQPESQSEERRLSWAKLAASLSKFLRFAGLFGELTTSLTDSALQIREAILGAEHIETAESLTGYGSLLRDKGDPRSALRYYRRALAVREKTQGAEHPDSIEAIRGLGATLRIIGEYAEAEQLLRRALEIKEQSGVAEDGNLLNSLSVLLSQKGDYKASAVVQRSAVEASRRAYGTEHPTTIATLRNLGTVHSQQGDFHTAEPIYRQVIELQERIFGANHPQTINSLGNLAGLLGDLGDHNGAEELFWRVLNARENLLGPDHPDVAQTLNNFAALLYERGHYAVAIPLVRRAAKIVERAYGADHRNTLSTLGNLASLLNAHGDYAAAEPLYRQVLATLERTLGPEHPSTVNSLSNLAVFLDERGDVDAAIPLLRRALEIEERVLGPEHPKVGTSLGNLAAMLRDTGEIDTAIPLYRRALAIAENAFGADHLTTGEAVYSLARAHEGLRDYAGAQPLYRRALQINERTHGVASTEVLECLHPLARVLIATAEHDAAEEICRRALDIANKTKGPDDFQTAVSLSKLAVVLARQGHHDDVEPMAQKALAIFDAIKGSDPTDVMVCVDYISDALWETGNVDGAAAARQRALDLRERAFGPDHGETAKGHASLAEILNSAGKSEAAEYHYRRALEIYERSEGPDAGKVALMAYRLGSLCYELNRYADAEQWYRRTLHVEQQTLEPDDPEFATTLTELGKTLIFVGRIENDRSKNEEALTLLRHAVQLSPRDRDDLAWTTTQIWLGVAATVMAEWEENRDRRKEAMDAFAAALDANPDNVTARERFEDARNRYEDT
jgi:nephrocystin-3